MAKELNKMVLKSETGQYLIDTIESLYYMMDRDDEKRNPKFVKKVTEILEESKTLLKQRNY